MKAAKYCNIELSLVFKKNCRSVWVYVYIFYIKILKNIVRIKNKISLIYMNTNYK